MKGKKKNEKKFCKFCGSKLLVELSKQDIHVKTRGFSCVVCGLVRNELVIDGEIMRVWVKK